MLVVSSWGRTIGLEWEVVKSGEHKDMGSPNRPLASSDREILQRLVGKLRDS